jgi:hypothetical protein
MLGATVVLALCGMTGSDMNDFLGSFAVFGFLTAYALVAAALPFARRVLDRHSHLVAAISVVTDSYEYDAFGNEVNHTGTTPINRFFRGERGNRIWVSTISVTASITRSPNGSCRAILPFCWQRALCSCLSRELPAR